MKSNAFNKLRLATAGAGMALAMGVAPVQAATVNLPLVVDQGNAVWGRSSASSSSSSLRAINNASASMVVTAGGATAPGSVFGIGDAFLIVGQTASGSVTDQLTDAFDRFAGIRVNGTFFQQPNGQVDRRRWALEHF
ncbi:MAG: hypothetical protein IGQ45_01175 [Cyanobacterium sp. T60_A2020_053]|nr:hypothetical protein [Cyanobacterium sp. T60_A2020_053]